MGDVGNRLTRRSCLGLLGALTMPMLASPRLAAAAREWRLTGYDIPELRAFDQALEDFMRPRGIRRGAIAVARNGRLLLARGYSWDEGGRATPPTALFRIASVSKPLTATCVMRLAQNGELDLSAPVATILTSAFNSSRERDPRFNQVTVMHLLQHRGGWIHDDGIDPMFHDAGVSRMLRVRWPITTGHIMAFMERRPVDVPPGSAHHYSNFGYCLLGRVIERVTGLPYEAAVRRTVLDPLDIVSMQCGRSLPEHRALPEVTYESSATGVNVMDGSGGRVPAPDGGFNLENLDSGGGWIASPIDLLRFAVSFGGSGREPELLSGSSVERMLVPPAAGTRGDGSYYGCGWNVRPSSDGRRAMWHPGSLPGTTALLMRRADGIDAAVVFNKRNDARETTAAEYHNDIERSLDRAVAGVQRWPTHDLFDSYREVTATHSGAGR